MFGHGGVAGAWPPRGAAGALDNFAAIGKPPMNLFNHFHAEAQRRGYSGAAATEVARLAVVRYRRRRPAAAALRRPPTRYAALGVSSVPPSPATDPLAEHRPFLDAAVANSDDEEPWWLWHDHLLARGHMRLAQLIRHSLLQSPDLGEGDASAPWRHTLSARPLDEAPPTFRMVPPGLGPFEAQRTRWALADGRPYGDLGPWAPSAELHRVQGRRRDDRSQMARLGPRLSPEERLLAWHAWQAHVGSLGQPGYHSDSVAGRTALDLYSHGVRPGATASATIGQGFPPRSPSHWGRGERAAWYVRHLPVARYAGGKFGTTGPAGVVPQAGVEAAQQATPKPKGVFGGPPLHPGNDLDVPRAVRDVHDQRFKAALKVAMKHAAVHAPEHLPHLQDLERVGLRDRKNNPQGFSDALITALALKGIHHRREMGPTLAHIVDNLLSPKNARGQARQTIFADKNGVPKTHGASRIRTYITTALMQLANPKAYPALNKASHQSMTRVERLGDLGRPPVPESRTPNYRERSGRGQSRGRWYGNGLPAGQMYYNWQFGDPKEQRAFLEHVKRMETDADLFPPEAKRLPLARIARDKMAGLDSGQRKALIQEFGLSQGERALKMIQHLYLLHTGQESPFSTIRQVGGGASSSAGRAGGARNTTSRWHFDDPEQGQAFLQHLQETEKDPSLFRGERGPVGRPIPLSQIAAAVMAGAPEGGHKALLATYGDNPLRRAKKLIDQLYEGFTGETRKERQEALSAPYAERQKAKGQPVPVEAKQDMRHLPAILESINENPEGASRQSLLDEFDYLTKEPASNPKAHAHRLDELLHQLTSRGIVEQTPGKHSSHYRVSARASGQLGGS